MSDIRKYITLIESAMDRPQIGGKELFTESMSVNFASHGLTEQQLIENRIQWLRDNVMGKLEPIADKENKSVEDVFKWIIEQDPSKNNQYSQWLMKIVSSKNSKSSLKDLENAKSILTKYDTMKKDKLLKPEHKDLNRFKSIEELASAIDSTEKRVTSEKDAVEKKARDESEIISEDGVWLVVIPKTEYAAGYWGKETLWCTSSGFEGGRQEDRTENYFDRYHEDGVLIILYNKKNTKNTYQFHILRNEFANSEDEMIEDSKQRRKIFDHFPKLKEYVYGKIQHEDEEYLTNVVEMFPTTNDEEIKKMVKTPEQALTFAKVMELTGNQYLENLMDSDDEIFVDYVLYVLKEPMESLDDRILKSPNRAFEYAILVTHEKFDRPTEIQLFKRFTKFETDNFGNMYINLYIKETNDKELRNAIFSSPSGLYYVKHILKQRSLEYEEHLSGKTIDDEDVFKYVTFVNNDLNVESFAKVMDYFDVYSTIDTLGENDMNDLVEDIARKMKSYPVAFSQKNFDELVSTLPESTSRFAVRRLMDLEGKFEFSQPFYRLISVVLPSIDLDTISPSMAEGILDELERDLSDVGIITPTTNNEYVNKVDLKGDPMDTLSRLWGLFKERADKRDEYREVLLQHAMNYGSDDEFYEPDGMLDMMVRMLPNYDERMEEYKREYLERMSGRVDGATLDAIESDLALE